VKLEGQFRFNTFLSCRLAMIVRELYKHPDLQKERFSWLEELEKKLENLRLVVKTVQEGPEE
jgi:hypothetical protein